MEPIRQASMGDDLHDACVSGDLDAMTASLAQSKAADPSFSPPFSSIMYTAASKNRVNIMKYCLENGAAVTPDVMRMLLIARAKETYIYLLDCKAVDIDYYIPWWSSILSNVAVDDNMDWAQLCLERGADPNKYLVDDHKKTLASVAEFASVEMAALLIRHGAGVNGSGAIVMAAEEGKLDMVKLLLSHGADIDEVGIRNPTDPRFDDMMGSALHRAVHAGHEDVVRFLLDQGADVNLKDVKGRTPLALAEAKQNLGIMGLLKDRGAR